MRQVLVVVPVGLRPQAEVAVRQIDADSVGLTFVIELSSNGQLPVTHVGCQPNVTDTAATAIEGMVPSFPGSSMFVASSPEDHLPMISRSLASLGLQKVDGE